MTIPTPIALSPDADLWQQVREGSTPAFEILVQRHQSLVCAVAYNACGNLALSEDVAQETFWTAWRERTSLQDPGRLRGWLCGIARNIGQNARRRAARPADSAAALDRVTEMATTAPGPDEAAASREEAALVWQTLEQIPASYREPLILFYREQQAVAEVAAALELSEDAVKQRLSRGREMLREGVAELVEGVLRRSRPGRGLTVAVMTGLSAMTAGAKTAMAGAGAAAVEMAAPSLKAAAGAAMTGGVLGSLIGLAGGWLGVWLPAQLAPTKRERDFLLRNGMRMLLVSVLFTVVLVGGGFLLAGRGAQEYYLVFWAAWMAAFLAYILVEVLRMNLAVKRMRAEAGSAEPNDAPLRLRANALAARYRGRVYRSRATFLALPLIDVNVSDPAPPGGASGAAASIPSRRMARGWIAIGDDARGVLAVGAATAVGLVAVGGRSVGVLSFGGIAVGLVAFGGLAVGGLAIGGLGVGWQACGGGSIAWDVAAGGGAVAWRGAVGGAAFAHDFALGGDARALHANDAAARAFLLDHPLRQGFEWYVANAAWVTPAYVLLLVLGCAAVMRLMYRRERTT